ncbi:MAG TPA: hypothetical protein PLJ60_18510 [Chryseolinea sp.]|nr:hypothetical protein [Chryseolinea sp.]
MNLESEKFTPEQSLDVITSMINQAKGNMQRSSFYFLLWGWTIVIANLGVYVLLKFTSVENPFLMFALTIPAGIIAIIYGVRNSKVVIVKTHLDNVSKWIWLGYGINCFIFVIVGKFINWQINPIIITMCAMPTFLSGVVLRFKPLMFGGIVFWILGIVSFLAPVEIQFLLAAVAVAFGYLIPGYLLKKSEG